MKYIDTYVLAEIAEGNKAYINYTSGDFLITDLTLAEFYWVLLRDKSKNLADFWYEKLRSYAVAVDQHTLISTMVFRYSNKKKNLSFFDCVGYVFAIQNNMLFVTGDKEFKDLPHVEHVPNKM